MRMGCSDAAVLVSRRDERPENPTAPFLSVFRPRARIFAKISIPS